MYKLFQQNLSYTVWRDTYKWDSDNDVYDTFRRVAKNLSSIEKNKEQWEEKFYDILKDFSFVAGGRITSNAGTNLKGTGYVNCFVSGFRGKHQDSIDSIYDELHRQAKILKSEGGYGCNFDVIRPRGSYINGIGVDSPGVVEWLNVWDASSATITSGTTKVNKKGKGKIRKGAMMGTLSIWHPGVEEFILAKQQNNVLERFNLSVLITNKFMEAVKNKDKWVLEFPDTTFKAYNNEWDGNLELWKSKGYPVITGKEYKDANELWDILIKANYDKGEPGVLFVDRINELNNLYYKEYITASNPCGEEPLPIGGSCVLASINLTKYVRDDCKDYDYAKLDEDIPTMVRFLDNVNDITNFPLPEQKKKAQENRRIGIGYLGFASSLYMMKIPYGSKKALNLIDTLASFVTNKLYQASSLLAKEKGAFPNYDKDKYLKSKFVKRALSEQTVDLIKKYGMRNSHVTTIAPTGNSSIFANNVSSGIEPVVYSEFVRTVICSSVPDGLIVPTKIDWVLHTYEQENGWKWVQEGEEFILRKEYNGTVYKIDSARGLCREEEVYDYAVFNSDSYEDDEKKYKKNKKKFYGVTIFDLGVDEHISTLSTFAKYIDSSVSKTINIPNDFPFNKFKNVYMKAFNTGFIKGMTTYREGTRKAVVSIKVEEKGKNGIEEVIAPERPKALPCEVHRISVNKEKWLVFVGLYKGQPFEVFTGIVDLVDIPSKIKEGMIVKIKSGIYSFEHEGEIIIKDINRIFSNTTNQGMTRMISQGLQHKITIDKLVYTLSKSGDNITNFSKCITRALKKYVPDGTEVEAYCPECNSPLVYLEGCYQCKNRCGFSKCG